MRTIVNIPRELMKAKTTDWQIDWRNQSSGEDTGGGDQTVVVGFPRWIGSPTVVMGAREIGAWSALRDLAQGRLAAYRVPMLSMIRGHYDAVEIPSTPLAYPIVARPVDQRRAIEARPVAIIQQAANPGDTSILVLENPITGVFAVGQIVSHEDWPMRVLWREREGAAVRLGVSFVRRAIPIGSALDLIPTGLFLAADPMAGNPAMDNSGMAVVQLSFQEWITR